MRGLIGLLLLSVILVRCKNENQKDNKEEYLDPSVFFCDAEQLSKDGTKFVAYGNEFNGGVGRTNEEAYEGEYSCLLDKNNMYGFTYVFKDLQPGDCFDISVARKNKGNKGIIVVQSVNDGVYKYEQVSFQKKDANGWDVLALKIQLPMNVDSLGGVKIYVYNGDPKEKVYFDNLKIHRYQRIPSQEQIKGDVMSIQLADEDWKKLKTYRDQAVKDKVISKKLKKEVKGILKYQGKTVKIKIRLKGDWTDHLEGDKWSYRVKIEDGQTIMGLKSFSIQNPTIRDFLQEWVIHEVCKKEDLLTTKYEYVPVAINGIDFGLYNLEEHFEKQLVESKNRREGVILKFDEEGFWEVNLFYKQNNVYINKPYYESSTIVPFKKKKTFKTPKLKEQFLIAQNLMQKYKNGEDNIENFMDIDRLAKAYALMDVGNIEHAFTWHNQRFYYNPVLSKLELITYDCYSKPGEALKRSFSIKGNENTEAATTPFDYCLKSAFDDDEFLKLYLKYLKKYSSKEYLTSIFNELTPQIDSLSALINKEYDYYFYDDTFLKENARKIRKELPEYEKKVKEDNIMFTLQEGKNICVSEKPFKHISLNAHIQETKQNGTVSLSLMNYHCRPIKVVGYGAKPSPDSLILLPKEVRLINYPKNKKETMLSINTAPKKLFFKVLETDDDSIYSVKVVPWKRPQVDLPYNMEPITSLAINDDLYLIEGNTIGFKKGVHYIKNNLFIPKGYKVNFEPGTELIFNNGTFFMSYSPVKMIGTKKDRIKISSEDATGNGFTVMQTEGKSRLEFVVFDGLNTYNKNGWNLTGAVTFFESEVEIENTIFTNNHCEDGLNIIQSKFVFESNLVSNTFADGFDADFCEGTITNSKFHDIGNDCLDFSGSTINVLSCEIKNAGDKGISCGEQSNITISKTSINNAVIGIASKDNTEVVIKSVSLSNCETGLSAFQKKPEYGPATITVESQNMDNITIPTFIEEGSKINIKN